jgi:hypothetical protein
VRLKKGWISGLRERRRKRGGRRGVVVVVGEGGKMIVEGLIDGEAVVVTSKSSGAPLDKARKD